MEATRLRRPDHGGTGRGLARGHRSGDDRSRDDVGRTRSTGRTSRRKTRVPVVGDDDLAVVELPIENTRHGLCEPVGAVVPWQDNGHRRTRAPGGSAEPGDFIVADPPSAPPLS